LKENKKLYKDFKIQVSIEKYKNLVDCTTVEEQGDNFAPILFIIVVQFLLNF